ncbi:restriction endonuclease subunit S [Methanosarcina vacuolata]|uniref:Type I restriction-modification system, specificity subunit S n=1 Tax=Methanosarcina vacuolata Z-761 TaxID=1434123 RepID=A0A0E3Q6Q2_9EURY|nr:restriction endonuclease subunit S [Methanosarcina vacuolata]AKB44428.1 Type I restriction-modification system, specificity subunit S [Methanosarcina vacuolata Z-761]
MISKWQHLSLREAGISLIDCVHKTPEAKNDGYPYVAIPQMKDGRIDLSSARKISHDDFLEWTIKAKPEANDVVLSRRCNPGESAYVPEGVEFALGQNLVLLRSDGKKVHKPYLRWLLNSPFWWAEIQKFMNVGAIFTSLKCADVLKFTLPIPPLDKQEKISEILYSIDTKIELNRQINQTLETMAQAIFKSWFVDFEPVKAKIAAIEVGEDTEGVTRAAMSAISGKTNEELDQLQVEQPDNYTQLKTTAELFPSTMQDSEFGEIPEGWTWKRADETCDISIGKTPPRKESQWFSSFPDGLKWISIRDMGECGVFVLDTSETLTHDAVKKFNVKKVPDNTLILSFKLTVGRVAITSGEMLTNEAIAHFIQKLGTNIPTSFYYLYLKQFDYNSLGSTSSIATAVNSKTIKALPIINPLEDVVGRFDAIVEPLFSQIKLVEKQNRDLSQLRDTLLPKLLSGELSVDAAKLAEE